MKFSELKVQNCTVCQASFKLTKKTALIIVFLEDYECNHIEVTCPNSHLVRLVIGSHRLSFMVRVWKIPHKIFVTAPEGFKMAIDTFGNIGVRVIRDDLIGRGYQ